MSLPRQSPGKRTIGFSSHLFHLTTNTAHVEADLLQAGDKDPDLFFRDRPREARQSLSNREYISFWADEAPGVVFGRSPIECYTDFMRSFRDAFVEDIGEAIEEVVIGCGPCGELR